MKFAVTYDKVFTKGLLKGFQVPAGFSAPDYAHLKSYLQKLRQDELTQKICKDAIGGGEYFICNVKAKIEE